MKSKLNLPRLAKVVALAFVAILVFASASVAQQLSLTYPKITFDSGGSTTYDAATDSLVIDASTLGVQFAPDKPPCPIAVNPGTFRINATVSDAHVVSGAPGALVINGGALQGVPPGFENVCIGLGAPMGFLNGNLVTGNVQGALGYNNTPDRIELTFTVTGGILFSQLGITSLGVIVSLDGDPNEPSTFNGTFAQSFSGSANGSAGVPLAPLPPPPPAHPAPTVVTSLDLVAEAGGPTGANVSYAAATATDLNNSQELAVTCAPAAGSLFPVGDTLVTCTSALDSGTPPESDTGTFTVKVQDTTAPKFYCGEDIDAGDVGACDIEVQATGLNGALVEFDVTAVDLVNGNVAVTCSAASGSLFAVTSTLVTCDAKDVTGNAATLAFTVTVKIVPPAPREGCFIVDFREITYFNQRKVITSSDAGIRTKNGILVPFNPAGDTRWPYRPGGGTGYTKSRGTLFRIYGFQPAELNQQIPDAVNSLVSYRVRYDSDTKGYYIDTGGPARVVICPDQLHNYVLAGRKRQGHRDGSTRLPTSQRNVPGIMLTHNSQITWLPPHVKAEMDQLGLEHRNRGVIDYIGVQLQGNGSAQFREFVDVEVLFPSDSDTDRAAHFKGGFHTALNTNFETFAGCSYFDYAPGNDSVRLRDAWGPIRQSLLLGYTYVNSSWAACGSLEPAVNQKVRANYEVPFNAIQLLPTVNTNTDTLRLFYGPIGIPPARLRIAND